MFRNFGIELEYIAPTLYPTQRQQVSDALNLAGVTNHLRARTQTVAPRSWSVKNDGSLGAQGLELASPILSGNAGLAKVRQTIATANAIGLQANDRCGIHVHIDARTLSPIEVAAIAWRWSMFQNEIDTYMPANRVGNHYCRPLSPLSRANAWQVLTTNRSSAIRADATFANLHTAICPTRYFTLNLCRLHDLGTIEFRQLEGSLDADRVVAWIHFLQDFGEETVRKTQATPTAVQVTTLPPTNPYRVGTKNYVCFEAIAAAPVSAATLKNLTGWRDQTIPSMMSDIRSKGFTVTRTTTAGVSYYQLGVTTTVRALPASRSTLQMQGVITDGLSPAARAFLA